jgi:hypothetical protein
MTYDIVIFTDIADKLSPQRGLGAYKIANLARAQGHSAIVVDFSSCITWQQYQTIINKTVGSNTICVGWSITWFPWRTFGGDQYLLGPESRDTRTVNFNEGMSWQIFLGNQKRYIDYVKQVNNRTECIVGGSKVFEYVQDAEWDRIFVGFCENQFVDYLQGKRQRIYNYDPRGHGDNHNFAGTLVSYEDTDCINSEEILTIEISRGCIFNCAFCSYPHIGQNTKDYTKYQDVLFKELNDNYKKWGVYQYYIVDDTFNDYTPKLELVNEVIQSLDYQPYFEAYVRMDLVARQKHQAQLMYDIGLRRIYYGLETWNNRTSKIVGKGNNRDIKIQGIKNCKQVWSDDVYVNAGYVVGLPQDNEQDVLDIVDWYSKEGNNYIDALSFNALLLKDLGDLNNFMFDSAIDRNPNHYNYTVDGLTWTRNDKGDISNSAQAQKIADFANQAVAEHNTFPPKVWKYWSLYDAYCNDIEGSENIKFKYFYDNFYYKQLMEKIDA